MFFFPTTCTRQSKSQHAGVMPTTAALRRVRQPDRRPEQPPAGAATAGAAVGRSSHFH